MVRCEASDEARPRRTWTYVAGSGQGGNEADGHFLFTEKKSRPSCPGRDHANLNPHHWEVYLVGAYRNTPLLILNGNRTRAFFLLDQIFFFSPFFLETFHTTRGIQKFCFPVKNGWHAEQISTWMVSLTEAVSTIFPHEQTAFAFLYSGWMPSFIIIPLKKIRGFPYYRRI